MVELNNLSRLDYPRFVFSFLLLAFATVVTLYAIFTGNTTFYDAVPGYAAFLIFLFNLILLGIAEGLQIALVELKRQHPNSYKNSHPRAYQLGQNASSSDNVEKFLMGRQVFVIFIVFFTSKITTVYLEDLNDFLFPVPPWVYHLFLETGFLTCILVVIVGQLMPQILASKYPVHFLNIWIMKYAYYACIIVEATGITHACWVLSYGLGLLAGIKSNEKVNLPDQFSIDEKSENCPPIELITNIHATAEMLEVDEKLNQVIAKEGKSTGFHKNYLENFTSLMTTLETEVDPQIRKILSSYLDAHPEKFYHFPSVVGNKIYLPPSDLANEFKIHGSEVPDFLRDISDPKHVPPHVVACELLMYVVRLQKEIEKLNGSKQSQAF